MTDELNQLFDNAESDGVLTRESNDILMGSIGEVVVAGAEGRALETIESTEVTLVTILLDRSSSIKHRGLADAVRDGYGMLVDSMQNSREAEDIMTALWTFNHERNVVHSYVPVDEAAKLDTDNYSCGGRTSLYDTWCEAIASNVAYAQKLRNGGTPCRSVVVVITDGEDVGSDKTTNNCEKVTRDVLASEQFVTAFVGVGDDYDFRTIAERMGVPDGSICVDEKADESSLREIFELVSRSVSKVSQGSISPGPNTSFFD